VSERFPVAIVGGGPVGLTASIALSVRGVKNVVLERQPHVYPLPRAIVMDAEIHRSLNDLGIGEGLKNLLSPMTRADFVDANGNELIGIDVSSLELFGLPAVSCHYQPQLDEYLLQQARELGAVIRNDCEVLSFEQNQEKVSLQTSANSSVVADFVIACDGASSAIRKQLGISLVDLAFDQDWLVVDLELTPSGKNLLPDATRQICDPKRPVTLVRGHKDFYRFEFQLQPDESPMEFKNEDQVWKLLSPWLSKVDAKLIRFAAYRFHGVVASAAQKGRVFLAGDSAHQMPPFMGQGLNTGMRDAFNLSWKIAYVLQNRLNVSLLDTYEIERKPHITNTVMHSIDTGRLIDQFAGRVSHGMDASAGYGGVRPRPRLGESGLVGSQDGCGEMWSQLSQIDSSFMSRSAFAVVGPAEIGHSLFFGDIKIEETVIPEVEKFFVLRPDGYVAEVCDSPGDVAEWIEQANRNFATQ
jgi:3-(3-hydroxy-phenyl)propionate hydroxylase